MSLHGLGQVNNLELQRLMQAKATQGGQRPATVSQQNVDMTRDGSIFNIQTPNSVNRRGFNEQNAENSVRPQSSIQSPQFSIASGAAAISGANGQASATRSGTTRTQQDAQLVNRLRNQSKKLSKTTQKEQKEMERTLKINQQRVEKNNAKLQRLTEDMIAESLAIDALNEELNSLMSTAPPPGSSSGQPPDRVVTIYTQISNRSARMSKYGGQINKLQYANNRSIRTLNRTSRMYNRSVIKNQQMMQQTQSKTDKVLENAFKFGEVAQYTTLSGQGVQIIAKGMRAVGQMMLATPWTAAAGAALISASVPIESTGVVVETVGNYGSMAAFATQSVCYAANGDYMGAMQSLSSAVTTASAAVKGTKQIASGFSSIKTQATQAMQQGLEKQAAKQLAEANIEQLKNEGFSKKQINQMAMDQTTGSLKDKTMEELMQEAKSPQLSSPESRIVGGNSIVQNSVEKGQSGLAQMVKEAKTAQNKDKKPKLNSFELSYKDLHKLIKNAGSQLMSLSAMFPQSQNQYGNYDYTIPQTSLETLRRIQARHGLI